MKNKYEIRENDVAILMNRKDGSTLETLVSLSDLERVMELPGTWSAYMSKSTKTFYVLGTTLGSSKKRKHIPLHRWIMQPPANLEVDHINHETTDNRRSNLRVVTRKENINNRRPPKRRFDGEMRNVYYNKKKDLWQVAFSISGRTVTFGSSRELEVAQKMAKEVREKLFLGG